MNILLFSNTSWSIKNFRYPLYKNLKQKYVISTLSSLDNDSEMLIQQGIEANFLEFEPSKISLVSDILFIFKFLRLIKKNNIDVILSFTTKPIFFAGIVSYIAGVKHIPTITGRGRTFEQGILSLIIQPLLKAILNKSKFIFFQNEQDRKTYIESFDIPLKKTVRVFGSGVEVPPGRKKPLPARKTFLMASRFLMEKGIEHYRKVASMSKSNSKFILCLQLFGDEDTFALEDFISKCHSSNVDLHFNVNNIYAFIEESTCVVLPSIYSEGLPRFLIEGISVGRLILSSNTPGCSDVFNDNGILLEEVSVSSLQEAINGIEALDDDVIDAMSINSSQLFKNKFTIDKILRQYTQILERK